MAARVGAIVDGDVAVPTNASLLVDQMVTAANLIANYFARQHW